MTECRAWAQARMQAASWQATVRAHTHTPSVALADKLCGCCCGAVQEAHENGVALVLACPQDEAERYCEDLRVNGLTSTMEPGC